MSRIVARSVFYALNLYGVKILDVFCYFFADYFARFVIKIALMHNKFYLIVHLYYEQTLTESVVSANFEAVMLLHLLNSVYYQHHLIA